MFNFQVIIVILFGVWLLLLSLLSLFIFKFFRRLSKGVKEPDLRKTLDRILNLLSKNEDGLQKAEKEIEKLKDEGFSHVQKIGLVRFNPFKEIGGDHSFSLAILDGKDSGLIITTLHTRERTRVYSKAIKNGKCEFELSEEEKKALLKAQKS